MEVWVVRKAAVNPSEGLCEHVFLFLERGPASRRNCLEGAQLRLSSETLPSCFPKCMLRFPFVCEYPFIPGLKRQPLPGGLPGHPVEGQPAERRFPTADTRVAADAGKDASFTDYREMQIKTTVRY